MRTPENASEKFTEFIAKKKFVRENDYPGIADEKIRPILTQKINSVASEFKSVAESKNPTDKIYQEKIGIGLSRFAEVYQELYKASIYGFGNNFGVPRQIRFGIRLNY